MKYAKIILTLISLIITQMPLLAQERVASIINSAEQQKNHFLLDSLDINRLDKEDLHLLDSALYIFHKLAMHDTTRVNALEIITENLKDVSWQRYQMLFQDMIESGLAENLDGDLKHWYAKRYALSLNNMGVLYFEKGDNPRALYYYKKSLAAQILLGDKDAISQSQHNIGMIYANQANIPLALDYYLKALKHVEKIDNKERTASYLNDIGLACKAQDNTTLALVYYNRALKMQVEIKDIDGQATSLNNIGALYDDIKKHDLALNYHLKSLELYNQSRNKQGIAIALNNIGVSYDQTSQIDKAIAYYQKALMIQTEIGHAEGIAYSYYNIGRVYREKGNLKIANEYLNKALKVANGLGQPSILINVNTQLSELAKDQGKFEESLNYMRKANVMKDSLNSAENERAAIKRSMRYEFDKATLKDSLQHAKIDEIKDLAIHLQQEEIHQDKIQKYLMLGVILLMTVVIYMAYKSYKQKQKDHEIIVRQKEEVENQKGEIERQHLEIKDSIRYAHRIQSAILPARKTIKSHFKKSFIYYVPKDIISSDFYWLQSALNDEGSDEQSDNTILFASADCTGQGVPAALMSVVCHNNLNRSVREYKLTDPGEILDKTNMLLEKTFQSKDEEIKDGMDLSLCSFNKTTRELKYAGANSSLWLFRKGITEFDQIEVYKPNRQPIGS